MTTVTADLPRPPTEPPPDPRPPAAPGGLDPSGVLAVLADAVDRGVAALVDCAVRTGHEVTWPSWTLDHEGEAATVRAGASDLYSGDAGITLALARLASRLDRSDLADLSDRALEALRLRPAPADPGLLSGEAGVAMVLGGWRSGVPSTTEASDLTSGLAGVLLVASRVGAPAEVARDLVARLRHRALADVWGSAWPDPTEEGDAARPLCGLAHGASGVVLALVEAAARWPGLADEALGLADAGLRWESTWSDPLRGGWPDLRSAEVAWPALWCHGAAGAGAVRLRLLELAGDDGGTRGPEAPWPVETIRAEAEVALQACGAAVVAAVQEVEERGIPAGGLSLCHGLGGPFALLADAARVLDAPHHLTVAREAAATLVSLLDEDAASWPSGYRRADGDLGLMTGVAGTVLVLDHLRDPHPDGSPLLLR